MEPNKKDKEETVSFLPNVVKTGKNFSRIMGIIGCLALCTFVASFYFFVAKKFYPDLTVSKVIEPSKTFIKNLWEKLFSPDSTPNIASTAASLQK